MSGNVKQFVDFSNNTASDTGENNAASIQPIVNGENVDQTVLQRPSESLRQRTEALKNASGDTLYLRDADRALVIAGPGQVTWPGSTTASASGIPTLGDTLYVLPMLTPGAAQTAPVPPVASAYGVIHLKRASDSMNSIAVTSMRRSYAAGDQINIEVTSGTVFACTLDTETGYQRTIHIVATASTTLSTVISALNGLLPAAPDNTQLVSAALEGGALGTDLILAPQAKQFMSGNYDGEGHAITPANLAAFFTANPTSALAEGDTLCIEYTMVSDTASTGGRRQSIPENSNTAVPVGSFFNSRVNPEKLVNAIPICKVVNGALVFGTGVEVPAGSTNVSLSTEDLGSRIIRNPGFEHGVTLNTGRYGISDWENRGDLAVNGAFRLNTTTPFSGGKHLEWNATSGLAATGRIEQAQEIPVNAGQNIRVTVMVRQLIAPTAGQYSVILYWGDANSIASGSTTVALQVLASTDASYRQVAQTVQVPAGKRVLKTVSLEVTGVTLGSTGVALLVDDLQVLVETQSGMTPAADNTRVRPQLVDAVVLEDPSTYQLGQLATLLRMDKASPASEGRVVGERKDQDYTGGNLPPALAWFGRLFQLGAKLLGSEAAALLPRVSADTSTVAGVDFTLMWESAREGETTGTYTQPATRLYTSNDGRWVMTINAKWDGAAWNKDVAGQSATKFGVSRDGLRLYTRVSDVAWNDTAWADTMRVTNPLETLTDALTPRISMSAFNGASGTDFTQLFSFNFTGYVYRVYAATDGGSPNLTLMLVINAGWNGTNWVKDTNAQASSRIVLYVVPAAGVGNQGIWFQDCKTTDTFPESDWTAGPTTATVKNAGGSLYTGRISAGPVSGSPNPQGRFTARPDGFGDGATASTFFVDSFWSFDSPNWFIDQFGNQDTHSGMIYEEFFNNAAPTGWQAATAGAGAVEYNYNGVSRIRLNPGGVDTAGIRTNGSVVQGAYSSFNIELLWENVLGKCQIGLCDGAANLDVGFIQDSATYGDENLRVALRTGAGLQVADTGLSISSLVNDWVKLRLFARGGSGLVTTTSVFWKLNSKKGGGSGVFTPGGAIVNPTTGRFWRADAQTGQLVVIERLCIGGHNNFGI